MSYTIVGMFPNNEDLDTVANQLNNAGFPAEDYHVSRYSNAALENQTSRNYDYKEDEKTTTGFSEIVKMTEASTVMPAAKATS